MEHDCELPWCGTKPQPGPAEAEKSSVTYGELVAVNAALADAIEGHVWDNMSVWQQRDWLLGMARTHRDPAETERKPGRYFITKPVPGGYGWWDVRLPDGPHGPNFSLVSIWRECPGAGPLAHEIRDRLNGTPEPNAALEELMAAIQAIAEMQTYGEMEDAGRPDTEQIIGNGERAVMIARAALAKCREVLK